MKKCIVHGHAMDDGVGIGPDKVWDRREIGQSQIGSKTKEPRGGVNQDEEA